MKTFQTIAIILSITLLACGTKNSKKIASENHDAKVEKVITLQDSDTINIPISNGYGKVMLSKQERQTAYISFDTGSYKHLHGKITPKDTIANIRFSQITMPDGTMDGPFWTEIDYNLPQKGIYKISLGENMMAGDPWGGIFTVEINLSN